MTTKSARKAVGRAPHTTLPPVEAKIPAEALNYRTNISFWRGRQLSFAAAWSGVVYVFRTQPNARIELAAMIAVAIVGLWFGISALEWGLLGLTVTMILALEAVNTAIETVVDLASPQIHPLAKIAKDTAAGALVIAVIGSIVVAAAIFLPRLWALVM